MPTTTYPSAFYFPSFYSPSLYSSSSYLSAAITILTTTFILPLQTYSSAYLYPLIYFSV